jgi:dihydrodipicolinate synthase/N-acetylneuraminate lyase
MLSGALAAAVTPLRDGGRALDEEAVAPLVAFLAAGGLDGVLALGTTGEGILLSIEERRRAVELFLAGRPPGFAVAVHCGAQTTEGTERLAGHAAEAGADAVAVIPPPYFALDDTALLEHLTSAGRACAPVPFYIYEFAAVSGYPVPVGVVEGLREACPNLRGLKVSDRPIDRVEPYLLEGLDVFVGFEPLVLAALDRGAAGAVSGLATAFPEVVAALVHGRSPEAHRIVTGLRTRLSGLPFHAAMKTILAFRGVPVRPDVRGPLRPVTVTERAEAQAMAAEVLRLRGGPERRSRAGGS